MRTVLGGFELKILQMLIHVKPLGCPVAICTLLNTHIIHMALNRKVA